MVRTILPSGYERDPCRGGMDCGMRGLTTKPLAHSPWWSALDVRLGQRPEDDGAEDVSNEVACHGQRELLRVQELEVLGHERGRAAGERGTQCAVEDHGHAGQDNPRLSLLWRNVSPGTASAHGVDRVWGYRGPRCWGRPLASGTASRGGVAWGMGSHHSEQSKEASKEKSKEKSKERQAVHRRFL